jgi:hypothetical protein
MMTRSFTWSMAFLLSALHATLVHGSLYDEFLSSSEPNESEWASGVLAPVGVDLGDTSLLEYPGEPYGEAFPLDLASTNDGCSSAGTATPGILKPRGNDDECATNPAAGEEPLVFPDLATLQVDQICPSKFWKTTSIPVCSLSLPNDIELQLGFPRLENSEVGGCFSWCD